MMKKTILITGGLGYIGSIAVVTFEQAGYKTIIVDNLINSDISVLNQIDTILGYKPDFFQIDLKDKDKLKDIFNKYNFDGVIHFAGLKSPFDSQKNSIKYFNNNIGGSISLFDVMNEFDVKNIVFSSSANTYSDKNIQPVKENDLQDTLNPYGTSKLIIEKILLDLSKFNGFKVMNLRYFNPIGAHNSGLLGENPVGLPNNLFPYIFKVLNGELEQLEIFGNDYDTNDGTGVRDFIDIEDLVSAHILAYNFINNYITSNGYFESFNVGTGKGTSVLECIKLVEETLKIKVNYKIGARRDGDIPVSFCDTSKINKILGFSAKINLRTSILNSWKYYNKK